MIKQLLAAAAALALVAPVAVQAQEVPSYASVQTDQQIHGRVTAFDGAYNLQVRDDNGYIDNVELHDGTIINPTGLTLAPGMVVSILGDNAGPAFDANEIDTPYVFENAVPFYAGHPWDYYGPSFDLSFFFGNTGWWHGGGRGGFDRNVAFANVTHVDRTVVNNYTNETTRVSRSMPVRTNTAPRFENAAPRFTNSAPREAQHAAPAATRDSGSHGRR